jgi:hypothetical protein
MRDRKAPALVAAVLLVGVVERLQKDFLLMRLYWSVWACGRSEMDL